jgi:uncharacterized protein (DUF305 family)
MHQLRFHLQLHWFWHRPPRLRKKECEMAPFPAICTNSATAAIGAMKMDSPGGAVAMPTDQAHKQAPDIDVAFQSQPHHQGTISLARVQLKYGKAPENNKLAE